MGARMLRNQLNREDFNVGRQHGHLRHLPQTQEHLCEQP
jgi:hypothetical protein